MLIDIYYNSQKMDCRNGGPLQFFFDLNCQGIHTQNKRRKDTE